MCNNDRTYPLNFPIDCKDCSSFLIVRGRVASCCRWFVAVMPSSEEESLWLVGSEAGSLSSGAGGHLQSHHHHHQHNQNQRQSRHQHQASRLDEQRSLAGLRPASQHRLYTEETMQAQPGNGGAQGAATATGGGRASPANNSAASATGPTAAGVQSSAAAGTTGDSAEHDLIDNAADATLLAQFHEDAIKQVRCFTSFFVFFLCLPTRLEVDEPDILSFFFFSFG